MKHLIQNFQLLKVITLKPQIFILVGVVFIFSIQLTAQTNGLNVTSVTYTGSETGTFEQIGDKTWAEYKTGSRQVHDTFTENQRDEWSVYLTKSDGASIQLDLWTKKITYNKHFLFNISESSSAAYSASTSTTVKPSYGKNFRPADWMYDNELIIENKELRQLAIPSSHDMGMYEVNGTYGQSVDLSDLENDGNVFAPDATEVVRGLSFLGPAYDQWCRTQEKNAYTQLNDGIRYFDIRVCVNGQGSLVTCHGLYGASMDAILNDVARFTSEHPQEIVILGFNHFWDREYQKSQNISPGGGEGMRDAKWNDLMSKISSKLGDRLVSNSFTPTSTLKEIWAAPNSNAQVICNFSFLPSAITRPNWAWVDQEKGTWVGEIQDRDDFKIKTRGQIDVGSNSGKFWSIKTVVTPDTDFIIKATDPLSNVKAGIRQMSLQTNNEVLGWVRNDWKTLPVNLVWSDFYNLSDLVKVCLERNGIAVDLSNTTVGRESNWKNWKWGYELFAEWGEQAGIDAVNWTGQAGIDAVNWFAQAGNDIYNWADNILNGEKVAAPQRGATAQNIPDGVRHYVVTLFHVGNWDHGSDNTFGGTHIELYGSISAIPKGEMYTNKNSNQFLFNKRSGDLVVLNKGEHYSITERKDFYVEESKANGASCDIISRLMEQDDFDNDHVYGSSSINFGTLPVGYYKEFEVFFNSDGDNEKVRVYYAVSRLK